MDLLICAAERLDLHVGYWFPEPNGIAINTLLDEGLHLLPAFLGTVNKVCASKADVIDARPCNVKNHCSRADGLCDIPISPPLDFESALIDCSRAMSVDTCEKGCPERLIE